MYEHYTIRLRDPIRWAYVKSRSGSRRAFAWAEVRFGKDLIAFEPAPSKTVKKGREVFVDPNTYR